MDIIRGRLKSCRNEERINRKGKEVIRRVAVFPYCSSVHNHVEQLFRRVAIKTLFCPTRKIGQMMQPVKDPLGLAFPAVYRILCSCCVGKTGRSIEVRCKEHRWYLRLGWEQKSALASQGRATGCKILFDKTKRLFQSSSCAAFTRVIAILHLCHTGYWNNVCKVLWNTNSAM